MQQPPNRLSLLLSYSGKKCRIKELQWLASDFTNSMWLCGWNLSLSDPCSLGLPWVTLMSAVPAVSCTCITSFCFVKGRLTVADLSSSLRFSNRMHFHRRVSEQCRFYWGRNGGWGEFTLHIPPLEHTHWILWSVKCPLSLWRLEVYLFDPSSYSTQPP